MSQENVELLRRMIEAFNGGDPEGFFALADPPPEFEFVLSGDFTPRCRAVLLTALLP